MSEREPAFGTDAVHGARVTAPLNEPVSLPVYHASGWTFSDLAQVDAIYDEQLAGAIYGPDGNPNILALEALLARLESAQACIATPGGMAAFAAVLFSVLRAGDRVVAAQALYGNTTWLIDHMAQFGVSAAHVDTNDLVAVERAVVDARLLLVETVSNPLLRVADIRALADLIHARGGMLLVDNTIASPYHCRPLELGADLALESATKFLGGHHDVVLGALCGSDELLAPIRKLALRLAIAPGSFDAWLIARSIATLDVRLARSAENALALARWLEQHPKVRRVHYPGLASHHDHAVARRVLERGFGSMISFEIDGGAIAFDKLLAGMRLIKLVLTFGGIQTTLSHPAKSSHRALSEQRRKELGIHDGFARMSVGIEALADIQADLDKGLRAL
jgi:cystathionine beta-lyase/cystathionine gamma-synthase